MKKNALILFPYLLKLHLDNLIIIFAGRHILSCPCVQSSQVELIMTNTEKNKENGRVGEKRRTPRKQNNEDKRD